PIEPGAANAEHCLQGQPVGGIILADTSSWTKADIAERSGKRLQRGDSARRLGGEELEAVQPEIEPAHDVRRPRGTRKKSDAGALDRLGEWLRQSGGDDELSSGLQCLIQLPFVQHRARPDDRAFDLGHLPDRAECSWSAQGHLEDGESSSYESLGEPSPILV